MSDKKKKSGGSILLKLLVLVVFVALLAFIGGWAYGNTLDPKKTFTQSVTVQADEDDVHKYIGDLKQWPEWGPWRDEDPEMTWEYSEKTNEVGSWTRWKSRHGNGELKFTAVDRKKGVDYLFTMEGWEPQKGSVIYTRDKDGLKVTWNSEMDMTDSIMGRYFIKFGEDAMNEMLTKGLNKLKKKVEAN
ncbi:MAG: SRPBCC family protein [Planctomycetes bacterium]|nr:SRPBCC family protein [Planctomycetota bacterium]MCW8134335.1 SRPBCC family protein [Planctomycetota bacterium]